MKCLDHPSGLRWYESDLLRAAGVVHAFSTRRGGVSAGPYDSLNLAATSTLPPGVAPDDPANIERNYDRLQAALGCPQHRRAWVRQVHGCDVCVMQRDALHEHPQADALWTSDPQVLLTVRVADCVPILLAGKDGRLVAAVHAGWRGVVSEVAPRAVATLLHAGGIRPHDLVAAIGPAICVDHFEVGPEVAEAFGAAQLSAAVRQRPPARPHVDLAAAVALQLQRSGLRDRDIDQSHLCTACDRDFYSHRRDQGVTGRLAAVIAPRA